MELIHGGVILRTWTVADAGALARIADNPRIAENLRDSFPSPYYLKDARKWIRSIIRTDPPCNFAILYEGEVAGNIGLLPKDNIYRKNIEIGYFIEERLWGRGLASAAVAAVTGYAFRYFDVLRIYAETFSDNAGSRKALENAGFRLEAVLHKAILKNNVVRDACIYSVLREDYEDPGVRINA